MSTAPIPGAHRTTAGLFPTLTTPEELELNRISSVPARLELRRRPTFEQGRGLEILGHALEYLIDSRMYLIDEPHTAADNEATKILMSLSRQIFHECADVIPPVQRLRIWLAERLRTPSS